MAENVMERRENLSGLVECRKKRIRISHSTWLSAELIESLDNEEMVNGFEDGIREGKRC